MDNWLERTELLLGSEKLELLRNAHVLVVGLGGVGAYAAEMVARAGVGRMTIADADAVAKMLRQMKTANAQRLVSMGNRYAAGRVSARQTSAGAARELLSGCEGIRWVAQKAQADRDEVRLLLPDMAYTLVVSPLLYGLTLLIAKTLRKRD